MTLSNTALTKITNLANQIKGLITTHANVTGSSSTKGHVQAGGTPQTIGTSLSAGTDNGYYARADHVHTVDYSNITNTPDLSIKEDSSNKESSITTSNSINPNKYASTKAVAEYALQKDITIESTDSLNDLYKPGFYRCSKSKAVQSELPNGFSSAYSLIVIATGTYTSLAQPYTNIYQLLIGDEIIYMREGILSSSNTMTVTTGWKRLNYDVDTTNGGTSGSSNLITSGAVYSGLSGKSDNGHTHPSYENPTIADNLTTNDSSKVLSAKQGKVLNDLIGNAISYINQ